jgi:chromosome partitioning protein
LYEFGRKLQNGSAKKDTALMRKIALVTQKGGSGKSTLASSLAVAAQEAGERVFVIDMDPLKTLVNWSELRGETDIPVESIPASKLAKALSILQKEGFTLVILDTPGTANRDTEAAIAAADLVVIPARPNVFDLWASETTVKVARAHRRQFCFVLNQCPPATQSERIHQGVEALEALGGLLSPFISSRVDFQEAARYGLGVTEYAPSSEAADEMRKLWQSVKRRLAKSKR